MKMMMIKVDLGAEGVTIETIVDVALVHIRQNIVIRNCHTVRMTKDDIGTIAEVVENTHMVGVQVTKETGLLSLIIRFFCIFYEIYHFRYTKRFRSDSNSNHHRSNTTTYCSDEKDRQPKSPRKSKSKSRKNDRNEEMRPEKDSVSDMKEKDLEAMLFVRKKILKEIDGKDNKEQRLKENISKEQHKRELSPTEEVPEKLLNHQERSDGKTMITI